MPSVNHLNEIAKIINVPDAANYESALEKRNQLDQWILESGNIRGINLDVPYDTQRDNKKNPSGACNVTCLSMCLRYIEPKLSKSDIDPDVLFTKANSKQMINILRRNYYKRVGWFETLVKNSRVNTVWYALRELANSILNDHKCIYDGAINIYEIVDYIEYARPVILGTTLTHSGHLIVAKGVLYDGNLTPTALICNDPWGNALTKYKDKNGSNVIYPISYLTSKLKLDRSLVFMQK